MPLHPQLYLLMQAGSCSKATHQAVQVFKHGLLAWTVVAKNRASGAAMGHAKTCFA